MQEKEKVILCRMNDYTPSSIEKIIKDGLDAFGLRQKAKGQITIKPNVVMAHHKVAPSAFTHPKFLDGVLCALEDRGEKGPKIVIAEKSGVGLPTSRMFKRAGYNNLKKKHKIKLLPIEEARKKTVPLQKGRVHKKSAFHFHPLGPTLVISPWNFPFLIPFYEIMSALVSGNSVVYRPSTSTPLTGLLIGDIFLEAGLSPGVLNTVVCKVPQAEEMITNPDIQSVKFTGSVSVGKRVMELASRNLTNIVLELGGKDPMIVLQDADLDRSSQGAVWGAFMNCGQSCGSVERLYVAREIADEFIERVLEHTKKLKVGNPQESGVDIGPMTTPSQLEIVENHIQDARENGAQVLWGGSRIKDLSGYFIQPTILTEVNHDMRIMREETFGPVLPIMTFSNTEEAVALANDCQYGLTASVWTRDKTLATWMAERIESGSITVNDHMFSFNEPGAIWGGIKNTGIGRTHGLFGLLELVNIKFVSLDFVKKKTQTWWFPYDPSKSQILEKSLTVFHHDRIMAKSKALLSLLSHIPRIKSGSPLQNFIKGFPRLFRK